MAARKSAYEAEDLSKGREERIRRLKHELREHIRYLADYEFLSADWMRMAESLLQIANVAFMETRLPPSEANPLTQQGRKSAGTLWDQERDELAIRILLEEGKLNLVLRLLHAYKERERNGAFAEQKQAAASKQTIDVSTVSQRCDIFEEGAGVLLQYALRHVEALQILDLPELLAHCREVIQQDLGAEQKAHQASEKEQSQVVLFYLESVGQHIEELDEDRVIELVEQNNLVTHVLNRLVSGHAHMRMELHRAALIFLSAVFKSESFATEPDRLVRDEATMKKIRDLRVLSLDGALDSQIVAQKDVRALLDVVAKYERRFGKCSIEPKPKAVPAKETH